MVRVGLCEDDPAIRRVVTEGLRLHGHDDYVHALALKTLMQLLGMPAGPCRAPLGKMSRTGLDVVVGIARSVQQNNPELFAPLAEFFNIDIDARLNDASLLEGLYYPEY